MTDKKTTQTPESLPWPFNYARLWYGVEFLESDVDYIISDPKYRLIAQAHEININFYRTNCLEKHDEPDCISSEEGVLSGLCRDL